MIAPPDLPVRLRQLDHDRLRAYADNLAFYRGQQWPGRARRGERRLTLNYARAFVDKVTSYLLGGSGMQVEPLDGADPAARERARVAERALREVEQANAIAQLDYETELDCAVLGDAAYKVTWDSDIAEVRVSAPDVQGIYAWRADDDASRVVAVASQYQVGPALPGAAAPVRVTEFWTQPRTTDAGRERRQPTRDRTLMGSSPSSSSRTCASQSSRGAAATSRRLWSPSAN